MNKYKKIISVLGITAAACLFAGCSTDDFKDRIVSKIENEDQGGETDVTPTPTPAPTATPIPTATPVPTSTPAPRRIGTKTPQSKYVYISNGLSEALREVYMCSTNTEDWGKNMIPVESTIKAGEKVQLCYTPSNSDGIYDLKIVDKKGNTYAIYGINFNDFEDATLRLEDGEVNLSYISLTTREETKADYSSTLAQSYDGPGRSSSRDEHEGDYDYGYYDDNGNWVSYDSYDYSYDYNDYSSYDYNDYSYDNNDYSDYGYGGYNDYVTYY